MEEASWAEGHDPGKQEGAGQKLESVGEYAGSRSLGGRGVGKLNTRMGI
jgi:hypothetical protein